LAVHDLSTRTARTAAPAAIWQIQLLGGLRATRGNLVLAHFPSRPVAALLARLALYPQRRHAREEVIELLWPGVELAVGRNRLRQVLSTLRRLLEPPGVPPDSVLVADRQSLGLLAQAVSCDVQEFERYLREKSVSLALQCYRGDLLPGFVDEWVEDERARLRALFELAQVRSDSAAQEARAPIVHPHAGETGPALPTMLASQDAPMRSLPAYVSVFFGREGEQQRLREALATHRLVTLTGFGGFGKTRLAVETCRAIEGVDTAAFVPLSECNDASQIAGQIRDALRMRASEEDTLAQLCAFLADRDVLLVLDNFEQLVEVGGTAVVVDLLERLPRLRCLVTSRRVLNVPGEREIALEPLPLPRASMELAEAARTPSVALFVDRAHGARPDFALTERNCSALIQLSQALEGLPLAIEIAASRIRAFSPQEMYAALDQRFALLMRQGQRAPRHGRHASLQMTAEWSWQLLSPQQQRFFAALSVFRGGWTAFAVESVCATADAGAQLEQLVADSLLRAETDAQGTTRFSMLETLREFAQERLGADRHTLRARHRAHYLQLARAAAAAESAVHEEEIPNLQQAIGSAVADDDPATALAIGVALRPHWEARGMPPAVLRLLEQAQASCPPDDPNLFTGLNLLALMALNSSDTEQAHAYAARTLTLAGSAPARRAPALVTLARVSWERHQRGEEVQPLLDEALALATAADLPHAHADALRVMATVALKHGSRHADYARADALFAQAEAMYRRAGQPSWAHRVLLSRVGCLTGRERYAEARQSLAVCEQYFAAHASTADLIAAANMTGYLESGQEHWREAVAAGTRCIQLAWDRHARLSLITALWNLPHPLAMLGDATVAATLMAFSARFWERNIGPLSPSDVSTVEDLRRMLTEALGAERVATVWAAGAELSLPEAVRLALTRAA
jgi:predicted ATPase